MIKGTRVIAGAIVVLLSAVACGRFGGTTAAPTVSNVYAGGVRIDDITSYLGDSSNWWPGAPQFGTRPLDSSIRPEEERFDITLHFVHVGSAETLDVEYRAWDSTSLASAIMSSTQQALGTSISGPNAGDQSLYYNQKLGFGAAPYVSEALVRVGQIVVSIVWSRAAAFASTAAQGNIAKRVVSRLKESLAGRVRPSPSSSPDPHFLPPDGPALTQLGTDTLPIAVVPVMVGAPAPLDLVAMFKELGANDFTYGDYVLNSDTHMEVLTAAFSFSSGTGGADWLNRFIGASSLSQNGDYFNYDDASGQYIAAFAVGSEGVLMLCRSAAQLEAASRACESPMSSVAGAWKQDLGG